MPVMAMPPQGRHHPPMPPSHLRPLSQGHPPSNDSRSTSSTGNIKGGSSENNGMKQITVSNSMGKVRHPFVKKASGVKWTPEEVSELLNIFLGNIQQSDL